MKRFYSIAMMFCLAGFSAAWESPVKDNAGTIPGLVRYSEKIPLDRFAVGQTRVNLKFQILDDLDASALWSEIQEVNLDATGRFQVLLGATITGGLPKVLFEGGTARWLVITSVDSPDEQPLIRSRFVSTPYALAAANAETLGGRAASEFVLRQEMIQGDMKKGSMKEGAESAAYREGQRFQSPLVQDPGSSDQIVDQQGSSQLLINRLEGLRFADRFPSLQAAIDDLPSTGGVVEIPNGTYLVSTCIDPGTKPLILRGHGWDTDVVAFIGDAQWTAANGVKGTVLQATGTNNVFCTTSSGANGIILRDLAILGPGSGTSRGISIDSASTTHVRLENVGVFNFYYGIYLKNTLDNHFDVTVRGDTYGVYMDPAGGNTEMTFQYVEAQRCGTGLFLAAQGIRVNAGLIQANTLGVEFYGTSQSTVKGIWYEANTNTLKFNSTPNNIVDITLADSRSGDTGAVLFAGANTVNRVVWQNFSAGGIKGPVVPAGGSQWQFINTNFATTPTITAGTGLIIGGSNISGIKIGTANGPILGAAGVGMISANGSNDINIGRYGSADAAAVALWGNSVQFGTANQSATNFYSDSVTTGVWNGGNFKVFSDTGTTSKFTVLGASGNTSIVGTLEVTGATTLSTASASGQITSTVSTGTAPLVIASTTNVPNLNASSLSGATFAAPGAIGGGTASAITGATITGNASVTSPAVAATTALTVGSGTPVTKIVKYAASLMAGSAPASVAATTCAEQTFAVSGLTTSDIVTVNGPAPTAGLGIAGVRVSAADTLAITWCNPTAGGLVPTAGTYDVLAHRF